MYYTNSQIRFKTSMLKSSLNVIIVIHKNMAAAGAQANNNSKEVVFENCAPFAGCISEINNTQIDNTKDIEVLMLIYNLIEYSDNYSKTSGSLWQY